MKECTFLVYDSIFIIEYLGISGINNVLDGVGILVHLGLYILITLALSELPPLDSIDPHHVLLANLIESISHFDMLLFKPFESLDLNKLYVLQRTVHRLSPLRIK
tara:strand:+ start:255 stop:569 length:315 start_codon:yes stop_codon:yes gene_type:complete